MEYPNFYENIKEANMRIRSTLVLYDGEPFYVICVCNHKIDGIFRVYMEEACTGMPYEHEINSVPYQGDNYPNVGVKMDQYLDSNPNSKIIRKMMNSPAFNRFRPFPLGMANHQGAAAYIERQPTRRIEQGLSGAMLTAYFHGKVDHPVSQVRLNSPSLKEAILGKYPAPAEALAALLSDDILNKAVAVSREFAFLEGPCETVFLAYKQDEVGFLPNNDLSVVRLSKRFAHLREVVEASGIFEKVQ